MKIDNSKIALYKQILSMNERNHQYDKVDVRLMIYEGLELRNPYCKFYDIKTDKEAELKTNSNYLVAGFNIFTDKYEKDDLVDIAKHITNELDKLLPTEKLKVTEADIKFISDNGMYYLAELD